MAAAALRLCLLVGTPGLASAETAGFLRFVGVDGTEDAWRPEGMNLYSDAGCTARLPVATATTFYSTKLLSDGKEEYTCPCWGGASGSCPCGDAQKDLGTCSYFGAATCQDGGSCPGGRCALVVGLPSSTTVRCVKFWQNHLGSSRRFMETVRVEYSSNCNGERGPWTRLVEKSMPHVEFRQSTDIVFEAQTCAESGTVVTPAFYYAGREFSGASNDYDDLSVEASSAVLGRAISIGFGARFDADQWAAFQLEGAGSGSNPTASVFTYSDNTPKFSWFTGVASGDNGLWEHSGKGFTVGESADFLVTANAEDSTATMVTIHKDGVLRASRGTNWFRVAGAWSPTKLLLGKVIDKVVEHGRYTRQMHGKIEHLGIFNGVLTWSEFHTWISAQRVTTTPTSSTSSSTLSSTLSSTGTSRRSSTGSTTYLPKPTCRATRMRCPVPAHEAGSYQILGSEGQANCSLKGDRAAPYFDFAFGACNASRSFDEASATVLDRATLVYVPESYGSLITGASAGRQASQVICVCESPQSALVSQGLRSQGEGPGSAAAITGAGDFQVTGSMHLSAAFDEPLSPGATLEAAAERLYLELRSSSSADVLGLESCVAAPSASMTDPFAVEYLAAGCAAGPLDLRTHAEDEPHAARISILNFRFAGTTELHLWCRVVRCAEEPCGECGSGRRLRGLSSREGQDQEVLVGAFRTQRSHEVRILPGPLALAAAPTLWRPAEGAGPAAGAAAGAAAGLAGPSAGARSNLTLFGSPPELSQAFLGTLATAVEERASQLLARDLAVLRIMAVPASGRRLSAADSSGQGLEALLLECLLRLEHSQDGPRVSTLLQDVGFQRLLAEGLEARVGGWASPVQLSFGALSQVAAAPATRPPDAEEHGCWSWLLLTAAAGVLAGCLSLLGLLQCRGQLLARAGEPSGKAAVPEKARAPAETQAEAPATEDTVRF